MVMVHICCRAVGPRSTVTHGKASALVSVRALAEVHAVTPLARFAAPAPELAHVVARSATLSGLVTTGNVGVFG